MVIRLSKSQEPGHAGSRFFFFTKEETDKQIAGKIVAMA